MARGNIENMITRRLIVGNFVDKISVNVDLRCNGHVFVQSVETSPCDLHRCVVCCAINGQLRGYYAFAVFCRG